MYYSHRTATNHAAARHLSTPPTTRPDPRIKSHPTQPTPSARTPPIRQNRPRRRAQAPSAVNSPSGKVPRPSPVRFIHSRAGAERSPATAGPRFRGFSDGGSYGSSFFQSVFLLLSGVLGEWLFGVGVDACGVVWDFHRQAGRQG